MNSIFRNTLLLLLFLGFTSCFEILEETDFKKDGSGVFKYTINLSQSKATINTLWNLDSSNGLKIPKKSEIDAYLNRAEKILKNAKGLTNASIKKDYNQYIFIIETKFSNTTALENALKQVYKEFSNQKALNENQKLSFLDKKFQRLFPSISKKNQSEISKPAVKKILEKAQYTTIYRFENEVIKKSDPNAKISPNKKAVMRKANIYKILMGTENISNTIDLK